jgi:hypothetical protein
MAAGGAVGLICIAAAVGILIGLIVGAVIIRCSCWIYNKMVGGMGRAGERYRDDEEREIRQYGGEDEEADDAEDDEDDEVHRPRIRRRPTVYDPDGPGVPEPSTGKAMGMAAVIIVLIAVANQIIKLATGVGGGRLGVFGPGAGAGAVGLALLVGCSQLLVDYLIVAGILTAMLPTKFGRGCLVALICIVIYIAIIVVVAIIIGVIIGFGAAGGWGR